ncbi:MAG TPA: radical SAM protein [Planctomycetota bacterium]|nr:radical SAM protein [Planctomycetota bacterium]
MNGDPVGLAIRPSPSPETLEEIRRNFGLDPAQRLLKTTQSLCPTCLRKIPAAVYEDGERVLMKKSCPEHGLQVALLENDRRFYHVSDLDATGQVLAPDAILPSGRATACCNGGAAPFSASGCDGVAKQDANPACVTVVEVTDACNLACPVCVSDSRGTAFISEERFEAQVKALLDKRPLDIVQLSGGEPTIHPSFWKFVDWLSRQPRVKSIQVPTNGLTLANEEFARKAVPYRGRLAFSLQLDGITDQTHQAIRGAPLRTAKELALKNLAALELPFQAVMVLARSVNEEEIAWVLDAAVSNPLMRSVVFQPVTYSGRYDLQVDGLERLCVSDIVKLIVRHGRGRFAEHHFVSVPCSHPMCATGALYLRKFGRIHNLNQHVDMARIRERIAGRVLQLKQGEVNQCLTDGAATWKQRLAAWMLRNLYREEEKLVVFIKPFMDRHSYDQDRVASCCHHILDTHGVPVSFCEYNATVRTRDRWPEYEGRK